MSSLDSIIAYAESAGARVGYFAALPDGSACSHRADEVFRSASTIKIAIMIELFRQIDDGQVSLADTYVLQESDKVPGSGVLQEMHAGLELTLKDVCYLMISISDNTATNILIDRVGMANVNTTMRSLGMTQSVLGRLMKGRLALEGEQENYATPGEFARMVAAILDGTAATAESCMAMMNMLRLQSNERRIGRFVPEGTDWGSKTGSYSTVVNDVGFVQTADGPLVVAVFTEEVPDMVAGEIIISEITRELLMLTA
ncbi:MAG: class A beta-lactamase-related serine hydrolase [Thermomicrobiales bacterium]|nr:class A beta-lactamase-related serine hydrolase [Thermomicrobiales bacterium]MCO5225887.1 class A beta-lactamase-related serine hydrolase [Thermomicrobiales bacterium]